MAIELSQTCRKFESFQDQNLDFQNFTKVHDSQYNPTKERNIQNILGEDTSNQTNLDISETLRGRQDKSLKS